jgi:glycosyltransferase involved in cell wall biosynthesis
MREALNIVIVQLFDFPSKMAHSVQILGTAAALARRSNSVHLHPRVVPGNDFAADLRKHYGYAAPDDLHVAPIGWKHKGIAGLLFRLHLLRHYLCRKHCVFYARQRRQALFLLMLRKWFGKRHWIVYEFHNLEHIVAAQEGKQAKAEKIEAEERKLVKGADRVVAISAPLAKEAASVFGIEQPLEVVPSGVDLERFYGIGSPKFDGSTTRLVYAGSLFEYKGVDALVGALAFLPDHVFLTVIGGNSPRDLERLQALALTIPGGDKRICFRGQVELSSVPGHLAEGDLIVIPASEEARSDRFTSPLKLFEAMATGIPLVIAPSEAMTSVLEDGRTAFFAASTSAQDLARAIGDAMEKPDLAIAIGQNAQEVSKAFGWDQRAELIERLSVS